MILSAAPMLVPTEVDESRREREAASRWHATEMRRTQAAALDLIDKKEGTPPMDAIEAMLRGGPRR